ncbi:hypothetical protein MMC10_003192 [Thelotrema lepadinum]|nr:hypothetical protein [Thelotrema lepadinum]
MEGRSLQLVVVSVVLAFLALVATVLRFYARCLVRQKWGIDDYLTVTGLVLAWGVCADNIVGAVVAKVGTEVGATKGLGTTSFTTSHPTDDLAVVFGKQYFYSLQILHACAMPVIKLAVLAFYQRIFRTSHTFKIALKVIGIYIGAWWFSTMTVTIFQCWPIFYSVTALTNALSDIVILIVPIPVVQSLQMTSNHKFAVLGMLLTGSLVTIAGIARTISFFMMPDIFNYKENFSFLIWTSAEPTLAVISACLPTFRPFLTPLTSSPRLKSLVSKITSYGSHSYSAPPPKRRKPSARAGHGGGMHTRALFGTVDEDARTYVYLEDRSGRRGDDGGGERGIGGMGKAARELVIDHGVYGGPGAEREREREGGEGVGLGRYA